MEPYCGRFTFGGIASSMVGVVAKASLIAPMNFRALFFRSFGYRRKFLFKPSRYSYRVLFVCFFQRFLRAKAPSVQIFTYSANRHINRPQLFDQLLDRNASPQGEGQFHLIWAFVTNHLSQLFFLRGCQCPAAALRTPSLFDGHRRSAVSKIGLVPFANGRFMNARNFGDFFELSSSFPKTNRLIANLLLGLCA